MFKLSKKEVKEFFESRPRVFYGRLLLLRVIPQKEIKAAFIIGSAVKRNAPARNLTRRRMSEIVRTAIPDFKKNFYMTFSYRLKNKKAPSFKDLKDDIIKLLFACGAL